MNDKERADSIERESFKILLEECAQTQQAQTATLHNLVKAIGDLTGKITEQERKQASHETPKEVVGTNEIRKIIQKGLTDIQLMIPKKPSSASRSFQVLLFPERDAELFYKIVFGRWFLMLVVMFSLSCLYKFTIHWNDNREHVQIEQLKNENIRKAWNYLYKSSNREDKLKMDEVYDRPNKK